MSNYKNIIKNLIFSSLPDYLFIKIIPIILPLFNPLRIGHRYIVEKKGNNFYSIGNNFEKIFFIGFKRVDRWLYPNGIVKGSERMIVKYLPSNFQISKQDVVVEVGANIGEFAIAMSNNGANVYSFEPDAEAFKCLELNTLKSNNVILYQIACSDHDGKVQFYLSSNDADSSVIPPESYTNVLEVECLTLSTICSEKIKKPIRLLKVEAEGYEPEVLSTLNLCHKNIQNITVDAGPERFGKSTKDEVSKLLIDNGYLISYKDDIVFGSKEGITF
jgi:FkbM family methyltransferase